MALALHWRLIRTSAWLIPLLGIASLSSAENLAGVDDPIRASSNYKLNCRGCHGPIGEGNISADVPRMQGFIGNFLKVDGGREFLVQVPGSATTPLPDDALAELLNWLLLTMGGTSMPEDFSPYDAREVAALRKTPETDVIGRRAALIEAMRNLGSGQAALTPEAR